MLKRKNQQSAAVRKMFETKSHSWQEAGLARQISAKAARKARRQAVVLIPLTVGVLMAYRYRTELFGVDMPIRLITVVALLILGWTLARDVGRALGPTLFR